MLKRLIAWIPVDLHNAFKGKVSMSGTTMQKKLVELITNYLKEGGENGQQ